MLAEQRIACQTRSPCAPGGAGNDAIVHFGNLSVLAEVEHIFGVKGHELKLTGRRQPGKLVLEAQWIARLLIQKEELRQDNGRHEYLRPPCNGFIECRFCVGAEVR